MKINQPIVVLTLGLIFGSLNSALAAFSFDFCYASTICGNPMMGYYSVSCSVGAHASGTACQFFAVPGVGVRCLGATDWGTWEWVNMSC